MGSKQADRAVGEGFEEQGRLSLRSGSMSNPVRLESQLCGDRGNGEGTEGCQEKVGRCLPGHRG